MELTILNLVLLTFVAGVLAALLLLSRWTLIRLPSRRKRKARRDAHRQARRAQEPVACEKMRKIYIDTFG